MRYALIVLALGLTGCEREPQVTFADVAITLPDDPLDLPPGPGRQTVIENCTACHSPSTMFQQPEISREKWQSLIGKMNGVYKASVDEASIPVIIDYLMTVQEKSADPEGGDPKV